MVGENKNFGLVRNARKLLNKNDDHRKYIQIYLDKISKNFGKKTTVRYVWAKK